MADDSPNEQVDLLVVRVDAQVALKGVPGDVAQLPERHVAEGETREHRRVLRAGREQCKFSQAGIGIEYFDIIPYIYLVETARKIQFFRRVPFGIVPGFSFNPGHPIFTCVFHSSIFSSLIIIKQ
jgi:hypothetical protein